MNRFEKVKRFADVDIQLPTRSTQISAGYDFYVAEDTYVPPYEQHLMNLMRDDIGAPKDNIVSLEKLAEITKKANARPTLVSTGVKCQLDPDKYLELSVRSSTPLKYWLLCANGEGIIDSDYYSCPENDGEIYIQLINLSPFTIKLNKGDKIAQGIIKSYYKTDDDNATGERIGGFGSTTK